LLCIYSSILNTQYSIFVIRTLFLNLAGHSDQPREGACIACVEDQKTVVIRFIDHRIDDVQLLPELDGVLEEAGWKMQDIGRIACVVGPGGFTSLRMAVTLANVLADELGIPVAGVHGSEVYAGRLSDELPVTSDEKNKKVHLRNSKLETQNSKLLWLHSTRSTHLFVRGFGAFTSLWSKPILLSIDEFLSNISSQIPNPKFPIPIPWAGELLPAHREALKDVRLVDAPLRPLEEVLPAFLSGLTYEKQILEPWYGRGW
jgi:tRNA threonylcarbamoyl adenosine modification protein YeaZ